MKKIFPGSAREWRAARIPRSGQAKGAQIIGKSDKRERFRGDEERNLLFLNQRDVIGRGDGRRSAFFYPDPERETERRGGAWSAARMIALYHYLF